MPDKNVVGDLAKIQITFSDITFRAFCSKGLRFCGRFVSGNYGSPAGKC